MTAEDALFHATEGLPSDQAAMRLAWRAADEWRRLADMREDMARCREKLMDHQAVLCSVSDAVRKEYVTLEEQTRGMDLKQRELNETTSRLDDLRLDLGWQYTQQQRFHAAGEHAAGQGLDRQTLEQQRWAETGLPYSNVSWQLDDGISGGMSHGTGRPGSPGRPNSPTNLGSPRGHRNPPAAEVGARSLLDAVSAQAFRDDGGAAPSLERLLARQEQHEVEQLHALQEGIAEKRRYLDQLMKADQEPKELPPPQSTRIPAPTQDSRILGVTAPWLGDLDLHQALFFEPPQPPPLDAAPPPAPPTPPGELPARARGRGRIEEPCPPPAPPPTLGDSVVSIAEPAGEMSPSRSDLGLSGLASAAGFTEASARGLQLLRNPPPPPPAPPPMTFGSSSCGGRAAGALEATGGAAAVGARVAWDALGTLPPVGAGVSWEALPPDAGAEASRDFGQAARQLFAAFASRSVGAVALPRGMRSGRVALGLQDFVRLANAAQLRLPTADLEAAFRETTRSFGAAPCAKGEEPTLAFELFVELLAEVGRRRFTELSDGQASEALFREHLLPLARRIRDTERANDPASSPVAA